jgi:hypothetical protein
MLELTPPLKPGSGRLAVHIMEPGGSLWLFRQEPDHFSTLLIPAAQRERLSTLMVRSDVDRPLHLKRRTTVDTTQRITLEPLDRIRLAQALLELERFEANPELPEWHARGYLTAAEADAINVAHPEWYADLDEGS